MAIQPPDTGSQTQQLVEQILPLLDALSQQPDADPDIVGQCIEAVSSMAGGGEGAPDGGELGASPEGYSGGSFDEATAAVQDFARQNEGNLPSTEEAPPEAADDEEEQRRFRR